MRSTQHRAAHGGPATATAALWKKLEVTGKWRYLGDMLLSHGQTYIGDLVAMGAAAIGPGRALAHRVNPVDGDQWVLVVDWVRA